ncbi:hypothetical protein [Hydrocoleum sp. CS-953]|uniref:hypothetical protein n=1 Tax=Hydrocoleum sp. CS-953 TaxID=1671698 RepID=UPI000B9B96BB|nr:hypothetical protein [Hydrocoleum sp. CS-953]
MKILNLYPQPLEQVGTYVRRSCKIERQDDDQIINSRVLWYEFPEIENLPTDTDSESYLIAVIMEAMLENRKIVVHGRVSRELLANLTEYRDAWCCWLPQVYHPVDFQVDEIVDNVVRLPSAVCAFSGGVDATFSVWRHAKTKNGYRSQAIKTCAIIHGFDIPLQNEEAFVTAFNQASATLKSIDIPLLPIRTNFRKVIWTNWEHVFAAALVAALQNFKKIVGTCLIGSSEPYKSLVFPWGSSPITDHLLSSEEFRVLHDGATHSRTQKVATINEWKEGCDNLRVCWQGALKDRNCGKCEKCLRTMFNFKANNLNIPACFRESSISDKSLFQIRASNDAVLSEWGEILDSAICNNVQDNWVKILSLTLNYQRALKSIKRFLKLVLRKGK